MRIPFRDPLPAPPIIPRSATTFPEALNALTRFLGGARGGVVVLSGAGLSVASGLADYRGAKGTYRRNPAYRPIYFHEFAAGHAARQRYWARSFLGWPNLARSAPNAGHAAIRDLHRLGVVRGVVTQNVDSFHNTVVTAATAADDDGPALPIVELHGYLRATVCLTCGEESSREAFQDDLARLNPAWRDQLAAGTDDDGDVDDDDDDDDRGSNFITTTVTGQKKKLKTNPDGDVDLPDAPFTTFRYPPCRKCLARPPGRGTVVEVDVDGAWLPGRSNGGILKPSVVMFGENIAPPVKRAAEAAVDGASRLLIVGTSLATASAWNLARRAKERGIPLAIVNLGGVRGEELFHKELLDDVTQTGERGVRVEMSTDELLPAVVERLKELS